MFFAPMGRFQLESIYLYFPPSSTNITAGTTVENKGKLILMDSSDFKKFGLPLLDNTHFNTFKYHVSCAGGKISVRIIYFYYQFFHRRPTQVVFSFPTGLSSLTRSYRKENTTCEWDDGGKICNKNK